METNDAPKSPRGRKPSKWQYTWHSRVEDTEHGPRLIASHGVDDGTNVVLYDTAKKAKAVVAFARAFGYIPNEYMRNA